MFICKVRKRGRSEESTNTGGGVEQTKASVALILLQR